MKNPAELQLPVISVVAASLNFALFTQNFEKDLSWGRLVYECHSVTCSIHPEDGDSGPKHTHLFWCLAVGGTWSEGVPPRVTGFPLASFHYKKYIFLDREKEKNLKKRDLRIGKRSQLGKGNGDVLRGEELGREGQSGCEERHRGGCGWGGCECRG